MSAGELLGESLVKPCGRRRCSRGRRREGELYAGTYRCDSLSFIAGRELYRARRDGNRMMVEHLVRAQTFGLIELHFVGPDTRDD